VKAAAESNGNGTGSYDFDLFTIGAGSGGVRGSRFAASYGGVALLEKGPFSQVLGHDMQCSPQAVVHGNAVGIVC
jgi:hypothetical protein